MKIYNIQLINSHINFPHKNSISLLQQIEKYGIYPEYQCRSGYCGACRTKLISGKVSYPSPPLAFLNPGEILLCCCKAESDLEIEL